MTTKNEQEQRVVKIGIFYDGGFFHHISNYYRYAHPRKQRISIPGLHDYVRERVAAIEGVAPRCAHVVDAHFFRGRFSAQQTLAREKLYSERLFDDVLMNEGVTTHYLPIQGNSEQGIDVWLSLEAYEMTLLRGYDFLVLIAGDSDFVPLARKVISRGTRVMLLGWNFEYTDDVGTLRQTTTSIRLINEVTYPVMMQDVMNDAGDSSIKQLFVDQGISAREEITKPAAAPAAEGAAAPAPAAPSERLKGIICTVKEGFGFIKCPQFPNNVFFHFSALQNCDFDEIMEGDLVLFSVEQREKGPVAKDVELFETDKA
ncbi:MAG: cold shock domain-containing protein [Lentisphaerae bacterium]|nr:cold shock domain-containing protein [Lentisphaerota bacterium]